MVKQTTRLFIIEQFRNDERLFWHRSKVHGTGWHSNYPKQAFSKSELCAELDFMVEQEFHVPTMMITELVMNRRGIGNENL